MRQLRDRVIGAQQRLDRQAERPLGGGLEDPASLRVQEFDVATGVENHDAVEHRVEHALEVARQIRPRGLRRAPGAGRPSPRSTGA